MAPTPTRRDRPRPRRRPGRPAHPTRAGSRAAAWTVAWTVGSRAVGRRRWSARLWWGHGGSRPAGAVPGALPGPAVEAAPGRGRPRVVRAAGADGPGRTGAAVRRGVALEVVLVLGAVTGGASWAVGGSGPRWVSRTMPAATTAAAAAPETAAVEALATTGPSPGRPARAANPGRGGAPPTAPTPPRYAAAAALSRAGASSAPETGVDLGEPR